MAAIIYEDYCKAFFECCIDAILITKPDGSVIRANSAACRMFGMTEEELCLSGRKSLVDTDDPRLADGIEERKKNGNIRTELNFIKKDGTKFPTEITSTIFQSKDGETLTLIVIRDMSAIKEAESCLTRENDLLEKLTTYDYLTKILNRRGLMKRIEEEMVRSAREGKPLSLAMVDMDLFKTINDIYGHLCGDEVLCRVAEVFSNNIRPYDILGRFAGDEFLFCFPSTALAEAVEISERLRKSLEATQIEYNGSKIRVTASFGLAEYSPGSGMNIDRLFSMADDQMYLAKRIRNCVHYEDIKPFDVQSMKFRRDSREN